MSDLKLDTVLRYAALGVPLFPCQPNGKAPATANGHHDATVDRDQISAWHAETPEANWAISPGDANPPLFIIDLDVKKHDGVAAFTKLCEANGWPVDTLTTTSPSGGKHLWYRGTGPTSAGKLADGIDTRGGGTGYILVYPSVIDGNAYTEPAWEQLEWGLLPVPDGMVAKLAEHTASPSQGNDDAAIDSNTGITRARLAIKKDIAEHGTPLDNQGTASDNRAFQLGARLRRDFALSHERVVDLLREDWAPDFDRDWLATKVTNASTYAQNGTGAKLPTAETTFATVEPPDEVDQVAAAVAKDERDAKREKYRGVRPSEGLNRPKATFWDADKIFPRSPVGNRILAYAMYSQHKTNLVLAKCIDAILEHKVKVLFAAGEDADEFLTERIPAQCKARGITVESLDPYLLVAETCPRLVDAEEVKAFIEEHRGFAPDIVVVDTLSEALTGEDEDRAAPASTAMHHANIIAKTFKASVILVHHEGKNRAKGGRGSSVFASGAAAAWKISFDREAGIVTTFVEKLKRGKAKFSVNSSTVIMTLDTDLGGDPAKVMTVVKPSAEDAARMAQRSRPVEITAAGLLKGQVVAAIRERLAAGATKIDVPTLALMMHPHGKGQSFEDVTRLRENEERAIRRAVAGSKGKLGVLSDLVELDNRGEPIRPYRFFLPDSYQGDDDTEGRD